MCRIFGLYVLKFKQMCFFYCVAGSRRQWLDEFSLRFSLVVVVVVFVGSSSSTELSRPLLRSKFLTRALAVGFSCCTSILDEVVFLDESSTVWIWELRRKLFAFSCCLLLAVVFVVVLVLVVVLAVFCSCWRRLSSDEFTGSLLSLRCLLFDCMVLTFRTLDEWSL